MATAKQVAWRKKFAAMSKAGSFKKARATRKANPVRRTVLLKPARKVNPAARKPTPGAARASTSYAVRVAGSRTALAYCKTEAAARKMAQLLANQSQRAHEVVRTTRV